MACVSLLSRFGRTCGQVLLNDGRPDSKSTASSVVDLPTFLRWLFGETGRPEPDYAHECMELFSVLVKVPPGTMAPGGFVGAVRSRATDRDVSIVGRACGAWPYQTQPRRPRSGFIRPLRQRLSQTRCFTTTSRYRPPLARWRTRRSHRRCRWRPRTATCAVASYAVSIARGAEPETVPADGCTASDGAWPPGLVAGWVHLGARRAHGARERSARQPPAAAGAADDVPARRGPPAAERR